MTWVVSLRVAAKSPRQRVPNYVSWHFEAKTKRAHENGVWEKRKGSTLCISNCGWAIKRSTFLFAWKFRFAVAAILTHSSIQPRKREPRTKEHRTCDPKRLRGAPATQHPWYREAPAPRISPESHAPRLQLSERGLTRVNRIKEVGLVNEGLWILSLEGSAEQCQK